MRWIGITGGMASGKSTVSHYFRALGGLVVDADVLAKEITESDLVVRQKIAQRFHDVFEGEFLNRKKLAQVVFENELLRKDLESILHPEIKKRVLSQKKLWEQEGHKWAFYDVPLLYETGMDKEFDCIIVVACSESLQYKRLSAKGYSREEAEARLKNQIPLIEKVQRADFILWNNEGLDDLKKASERLFEKLKP